ncbi:MAG: toll/interleukin-1 receptor domain-containing protein [Deltaproteobacteria bacterium]|nr:toll/interleukin-1 receptor domain-containing protein [Deltaproteobacteria bacterium]
MGDSIRRRIDHGLVRSRFGIVVLSHAFFAKKWPQLELDGLAALEVAGRQRILPIWHGLRAPRGHLQPDARREGRGANIRPISIREIAEEIAALIRRS